MSDYNDIDMGGLPQDTSPQSADTGPHVPASASLSIPSRPGLDPGTSPILAPTVHSGACASTPDSPRTSRSPDSRDHDFTTVPPAIKTRRFLAPVYPEVLSVGERIMINNLAFIASQNEETHRILLAFGPPNGSSVRSPGETTAETEPIGTLATDDTLAKSGISKGLEKKAHSKPKTPSAGQKGNGGDGDDIEEENKDNEGSRSVPATRGEASKVVKE